MSDSNRKILLDCLRVLLKPVVKFCLKHQLHLQDVYESVKLVFIDAAISEAKEADVKVNISRISAMTGVHRRDVMRIHRDEEVKEEPKSVIHRVINRWRQDKKYTNASGKPRVLTTEGDSCEFRGLVGSISNDLNWCTILIELERIGAVERTPNGAKLLARVYLPKGDLAESMAILSDDVKDLSEIVFDNVFNTPDNPSLHVRTEYDNVSLHAVPVIHEWLMREGSALHQKARNFISRYDLDVSKKKSGKGGVKVVLGTFGGVSLPNK